MQFSVVGLRNTVLCMLGSAALAACGGEADSSSKAGVSVDAAYGALVSDVAQCAKEVDTCLTAAGSDEVAVDQCRTDFASCKDTAGKRAENSLAAAVTACTSEHRECAKANQKTDTGVRACKEELRSCMAAAHPQHADDDAGVEESESKPNSGKKDCLVDLHTCVEADGNAAACAQEVRGCVVASLPSGDVVAPKQRPTQAHDKDDDAGVSMHEGKGKPADAGKPADPGSEGKGRAAEARKCVSSFSGCVEAGSAARDCVSALKDCKSAVEP